MSRCVILAALAIAVPIGVECQDNLQDVAKASQNPISSMISLPLQNNFNYGTGIPERLQYVLNVQPVVPVKITSDLNLIVRTIAPIVNQPIGRDHTETGMGDLTVETFFAPARPGDNGFMLGAGPAFTVPTATSSALGSERWLAGISAVVVVAPDPWVLGVLVVQQWSYAGDDARAVTNPFVLQPIINYNLPRGWAITSSPIMTADWAQFDDALFVPIGGGPSKAFTVGTQFMSAGVQGYVNAVRRHGMSDWTLRVTYSLLFPL